MLRGIDVSRYQGAINWLAVAPQVDFAFVKAGGGDDIAPYTDRMAASNTILARQAGVRFGYYWYFSGRNSVETQLAKIAAFQLDNPGNVLPWVIDIEDATRGADDILSGLELAGMVETLTGVKPLIYTGAWYWNPRWVLARRMGAPAAVPFPLWVASYTPEAVMPYGWDDWTVWQYSDRGSVEGIAGAVDLDHARAPFWPIPQEGPMPKYKIIATALNLRSEPNAASERLADPPLPGGAIVEADIPVSGWHRVKLANGQQAAGGVAFTPPPKYRVPDYGYISAAWTEPVVVQPPPSTHPAYRIGVHVIGNMRAAETALAAGAPVIFGMHDHLKMHQLALAHPDRIFVYRGYIEAGAKPTPRDVFNQLQVGRDNPPNLWYVGTNENDHFGDDPEALRGRVHWDKDLFHMLKDVRSDIRYFGLSLGHGCPGGIEDPNGPVTAALMGYADLWNEGMGIDLHNYTKGKRYPDDPPGDALIHDPIWYERRADFWFRNGILDPRKGGGFIHGETGVEAGHGGYLWAGYNRQQFGRHIRTLSDLGRGQIVVPSGPYAGTWPSVDVAGAIYQMGNTDTGSGGWAGYNVEPQLPELRAFWAEGG